jgi:hypothetical protein
MQRLEIARWPDKANITDAFIKRVATQTQQFEYNSGATGEWVKLHSGLGYLPLQIALPIDNIRAEALSVVDQMVDLEVGGHDSRGWTGLGLYGVSAAQQGDYGSSSSASTGQWTDIARTYMPKTVEFFETVWPHEKFWKIRLLGLKPGGVIGMHHDDCTGLDQINIGIDHPNDCNFYIDRAGIVPFENGRVFVTDVKRWHAVVNNSDRVRLHITVYQEDGKEFQDLVKISYHEYAKSLACC